MVKKMKFFLKIILFFRYIQTHLSLILIEIQPETIFILVELISKRYVTINFGVFVKFKYIGISI